MERVEVTRRMVGLIHMQVCAVADATDEEILAVCNRENPSGTSNGWGIVYKEDDEFFGQTAPTDCEEYTGRKHFIVGC